MSLAAVLPVPDLKPNPHATDRLIQAVFCDFDMLCAASVSVVKRVLNGQQYRAKVRFQNATFHFYHGCLMSKVVYDNRLIHLPVFAWKDSDKNQATLLPAPDRVVSELLRLPKAVRLFYLTLVKHVFGNQPLCFSSSQQRALFSDVLAEAVW